MIMPSNNSQSTAATDAAPGASALPEETEESCCNASSQECGEDAAAAGGEPAESGGTCPTPMSWRGVMKKFGEEATTAVVNRDGYSLYCRAWGEGEPLYFLNGFGGTSELFVLTAAVLRDEYRCVFIDEFSSEAGSRLPPRTVSVPEAVADLFAVADHFGDDAILLYGATLGGALGLAAMHAQPQRIRRAAFQGGFAARHFSPAERLLIALGQYVPGRLQHVPLRASVQKQNHGLWFPPFDGSRWKFLADNCDSVPLRIIARRAALAQQIDLRSQLDQISQPTLIVQTEGEGRIATACQAELKSRLPNVEEFWIDSTGQVPYLTHPHRLAKLLKPFYRGEPLPESGSAPPAVQDVAATPFANTTESHDD